MQNLQISYYIDWRGLEDFDYAFDEHHIPRVDYSAEIGLKYNAITISQWGLANLQWWDHFRTQNYLDIALACADWLCANAQPWQHGSLVWIYDYGHDLYGPYPPWISGMAQGEAVSLLLRAFQLTSNDQYLRVAEKAIIPFHHLFADGGVADNLQDGIWFQEYPVAPAVHVLNGGIFALWGVHDFAAARDDSACRFLADKAVETLAKHWQLWDNGYWSIYDLYRIPRLASKMYHELHIRQMLALQELFPDKGFAEIAKRWQKQQSNKVNQTRWIFGKVNEKIKLKQAQS